MQLSLFKRLGLLGAALLTTALTGHAAAQESRTGTAAETHVPAPSTSPTVAPRPAGTPHAVGRQPGSPTKLTNGTAPTGSTKSSKPTESAPMKRVPTKAAPQKTAATPALGPAGSHRTTGTSAVALTFDDGPDPAQTPKLLDLLAQQHVHATFCLVGQNVQAHPELVRQIVAGGHTLCNHTWRHSLTIGKQSAAADPGRPAAYQRRDPQGGPRGEDQVLPGSGRQLHPATRHGGQAAGHDVDLLEGRPARLGPLRRASPTPPTAAG